MQNREIKKLCHCHFPADRWIKFAAGCSREVIAQGAEMLGWELDELFDKTILAMRSCEAAVAEAMEKNV